MGLSALSVVLAVVLILLAILGFANALYITLVTYHLIDAGSRWVPKFCRLEEGACGSVITTRYARVFGCPNTLFGLAFYLLLLVTGFSRLTTGHFLYVGYSLVGAVASLVLGVYLVHALLVRLKAP